MSLRLSASRTGTFLTCRRKYYYTYEQRIMPQARNLPMEFGSAWGLAMDAWHEGGTLDDALTVFGAAYSAPPEERLRTVLTGKNLLELYAQRWPRPELFTVKASERWVEAPLPNTDVLWCGKLDKLLEEEGQRYVLEHKTTASYLNSRTLMRYQPSLQAIGYGFLATTFQAQPKVVYDLTHVSRLEPKHGERFLRYEVRVEPWQMEELGQVAQQTAQALERLSPGGESLPEDAWTPNWEACTQYGGCPFRPLCLAPQRTRARLMEEHYQPRPQQALQPEEEPHGE